MKPTFTFFLLFITIIACAQQFSDVVEVPNKTSKQLYASAREWFALTFKSATDVLKMDDPTAGKLIGKGSSHISDSFVMSGGIMNVPITMDWYPSFTISVAVKDGKYKCDISEIFIRSQVKGSTIETPESPFSEFQSQKEFYKNGRDPEWYSKNVPGAEKFSRGNIKKAAQVFESNYRLITKTEDEFADLLAGLQKKMKENDNW